MTTCKENTLRVLQEARAWLAEPTHWTQREYWKDVTGLPLRLVDDRSMVASTCASGALLLFLPRPCPIDFKTMTMAVDELCFALPDGPGCDASKISFYNDDPERTHAEILAWFDRAITACTATPGAAE